jgi:hypothetical protein
MLGSSRVAVQLAASREGLGSMSDDDDEYKMDIRRMLLCNISPCLASYARNMSDSMKLYSVVHKMCYLNCNISACFKSKKKIKSIILFPVNLNAEIR